MTGLVNLVNSQIDDLDYQSATLHFGYLFGRNVGLVAEGTYVFSGHSIRQGQPGICLRILTHGRAALVFLLSLFRHYKT